MKRSIKEIDSIRTREDFVAFLESLLADLKQRPDEWENNTLESYLEAAAAWTNDMDGYYRNFNKPIPENVDWQVFANILLAAVVYE